MFYTGQMHEQNSIMAFTHAVRFETNNDPRVYLNNVASTFLDKAGSVENAGVHHFPSGRTLRVGVVREVSAAQFQQMAGWQSITTV